MPKAGKLIGVFAAAIACSLPIAPAQSVAGASASDGLAIAAGVFSTSNPKAAFK